MLPRTDAPEIANACSPSSEIFSIISLFAPTVIPNRNNNKMIVAEISFPVFRINTLWRNKYPVRIPVIMIPNTVNIELSILVQT